MSISVRPKCVLWGGYAGGNTGDELTLAVALHDARRRFGDSVAVLSGHPEYTQWLFPDVQVIFYTPALPAGRWQLLRHLSLRFRRYVWSYNLYSSPYRLQDQLNPKVGAVQQWVQTIINSHELYLVGGGYFTDLFPIYYYLLPCNVATSASIPILTAPIGLGPFTSKRCAELLVQALWKAKVIVRDESSLDFCRKHKMPAALKPDDGFRMLEVIPELSRLTSSDLPMVKASPRAKIGVSIFSQNGSNSYDFEQWWVNFLSILKHYTGELDLEGFCFHTYHLLDFSMMVRLFSSTGWDVKRVHPPKLDFRDAIKKLQEYDVVISSRFHAIIASSVLRIPHIAVASGEYYTAKMSAAVHPADMPCRLAISSKDSAEEIAEYVVSLCRTRGMRLRNA